MPDALVTAKPLVAEIVQKRSNFLGSGVRQQEAKFISGFACLCCILRGTKC